MNIISTTINYTSVSSSSLPTTSTPYLLTPTTTLISTSSTPTIIYSTTTVSTSTFSTTLQTLITDHLNSIEKVLDFSTGLTLSTSTYKSFGKVEKLGDTNSNRGYTNHQMDNPNQKDSLIYMNARYQSPSYGVFLSSDEVTTSLNSSMQDYLHNPQGLSEYKYALNNPVMYWDPDGRIWVGVNGTSFFGTNSNWDAQEFVSSIKSDERFKGQDVGYFNWSGADNEKAREQASYDLATYIDNTMKLYGPNEPLNVFAHSHGYQPVSLYSWSELSYPINNFISIESPNTGLVPNYNKIQNHVHTYSKFDFVQYLGGLNHNVTDVIGAALYASTGGKGLSGVFSLNWGQFGLTSSRNISGALNIDISSYHKNPLEEGLFLGVKNHYIQNSGSTDIYKKEISPKLK